MEIRHLLVLWAMLWAACAPPTGAGFEEEDGAPEDTSPREAAAWMPCSIAATLLADISPGGVGSKPRELVSAAGALFFTAEDGTHGRELWRSSGSLGSGTSLVKDIRPGTATSNARRLTVVGDKVFFTAEDGVHGRELWVSDGSAVGTVMVKDIWPGAGGSAPDQLLAFGDVVYFAANDGVHGTELWRSDGTPEGTSLVEDLASDGSSSPRRLARVGDVLYFAANVSGSLYVWRSLGVPGSTHSIFSAPGDNLLLSPTAVDQSLFFLEGSTDGQAHLWQSRSSPAEPVRSFPGFYPHDLTALGGKLVFSAGGGEEGLPGDPHGEELWISDGTAWGTVMVKDLRPGPSGSAPGALSVVGGALYFAADDGAHGRELWRSDGTSQGSTLLRELVPGASGSSPQELTALSGLLFFSAETPGRGREPWMSDGTAAGTVPLEELAPGQASSNPTGFVRAGWDLFFTATDGVHGEELWTLTFRRGDRCPSALAQ
jgi:ELWxxDGT repeat protein